MSVVFETMMKSSAVSVWNLPGLDGRERVAIFPSGSPVENEKEAAEAWRTSSSKARAPAALFLVERAAHPNSPGPRIAGVSFVVFILFRSFVITGFIYVSAFLTGAKRGRRSKRIRFAFPRVGETPGEVVPTNGATGL